MTAKDKRNGNLNDFKGQNYRSNTTHSNNCCNLDIDFELVRNNWSNEDVQPFLDYLYSFSKGESKGEWEKRIVNTQLKCIAVPSNAVTDIVKNIKKGNFLAFIDVFFEVWDNLTLVNILGKLICEIKDFNQFKQYLIKYAKRIDNWSSCDCLKFKCKANKSDYLALSKQMLASQKPFERRIGLGILFKNVPMFIDEVFDALNSLSNETEYYVNMMGAWLLAECMVKARDRAIQFFENNHTNSFIINKAISKCRDSFRISTQDKQLLLEYKICKN